LTTQEILLILQLVSPTYLVLSDHTNTQYTNTNIITTIYTILSPYLVLSDTDTVSTQTQILLLQSTQFYNHILSCLTHTVSTQTQILLLQSTQFYNHILSCLTHTVSQPFFVRRGGHCCLGDLVGRTTFWFFLSGLQKLEKWAKKFIELRGEYVE